MVEMLGEALGYVRAAAASLVADPRWGLELGLRALAAGELLEEAGAQPCYIGDEIGVADALDQAISRIDATRTVAPPAAAILLHELRDQVG